MRIGFNARVLSDPEVRGLSRYTVCLLRALSSLPNIELVLFSKEPIASNHVADIKTRTVTFDGRRETLWNDVLLPQALKREAIDIFHAPADRGLPAIRVCPMVVTVHGWYEREQWRAVFPTTKGRLWFWKNEVINGWRADAVITVSNTAREHLIRLGVAPSRRIYCSPLAPDPVFAPSIRETDVLALERYSLRRPYVLNVGGYDRWKNMDALISAFDRSALKDHLLVICGKHTQHYFRRIGDWKQLARFQDIRFVAPRPEDLPALYRHASFFVHPSLCESFALPVVEAMASGCPVACSDKTALPETAGDAAFFFDPYNVDAITEAFNQLGQNNCLRHSLRDKGLKNVQRFSWNKTAEETLKIYTAVAGTLGSS